MTNFVCDNLSKPALITNLQTCNHWVEMPVQAETPKQSLIPDLTAADRDAILYWIISLFAVVFVVKRLRQMFWA